MNRGKARRPKDQGGGDESDALRALAVRTAPEDKKLRVEVDLENTSDRTLHVVAEMRGMRYDAATRSLTVLLTDAGFEPSPGALWKIPRLRTVDPGGRMTLELRVPNRITRLVPVPGQAAPGIETIDLTTAVDEVGVEIAWSRNPIYRDVRAGAGEEPPLQRWQTGVARSRGPMTGRGGEAGQS